MTCQDSSHIQLRLAAIVLAAGYSSRMGAMKVMLPVKMEPLILRQIRLLQEAGVKKMVVVTGHDAQRLSLLLERETDPGSVKIIWNAEYDRGMFSSIQAGVREIAGWPVDGFFLIPADQPLRDSSILSTLSRAFYDCDQCLVVPSYQGKQGHPPVIPITLLAKILSYQGEDGMRGVYRESALPNVSVEAGDPFTVMDMNTPEEYRRFLLELEAPTDPQGSCHQKPLSSQNGSRQQPSGSWEEQRLLRTVRGPASRTGHRFRRPR